jgi:glycosyltransferase involved in cell wall biosynthesis
LAKQYRLYLLNKWAQAAVDLARQIRPDLIRSYGHQINTYVASCIKKQCGVPYVVSLHGNPDVDYFRGRLAHSPEERLIGELELPSELVGLRHADHVIAVYSPIVPYLEKYGIKKHSVVHNVVGLGVLGRENYRIDKENVKCICVGRQQSFQKDPTPIVDAVTEMKNLSLLLIGDGDLHQSLVERVHQAGAQDRIRFLKAAPNEDVLSQLKMADIFVYSSINYEISKGTIEAALTGLPIVINDRNGTPARELLGGHFLLVDGSKESYYSALNRIICEDVFREQLGRKAYEHAQEHWSPAKTEARYAEIYQSVIMEKAGRNAG